MAELRTKEQLDREIEGGGYGLHWEALDAGLAVPGLVAPSLCCDHSETRCVEGESHAS